MTVPVIFRFYRLRGGRTKGLKRRPFVNTGLTFGGLGLKASDKQQFARIQIVRKGQGLGANLSKSYVQ